MFDRRIICGKNWYYCKIKRMDNKAGTNYAEEFLRLYGDIEWKLNYVLLFDYFYAHEYYFTLASGHSEINLNSNHVAIQTMDVIAKTLDNIHAMPFQKAFPLCGKMLTTYIAELDISQFHIALFAPSEEYDICTMGWDAYERLFILAYNSYSDDEPLDLYMDAFMYYTENGEVEYTIYTVQEFAEEQRVGQWEYHTQPETQFSVQQRLEDWSHKLHVLPICRTGKSFLSDVFT